MKNVKWIVSSLLLVGILATTFVGCNKDDEPPALTLVSLKAGSIDLNGSTSAVGVPTSVTIVAEFSTEVDQTSVDAVSLTRDFDGADYPVTISVDGKMVTITPSGLFSTGTLFKLTLAGTLKSTGAKTLGTTLSRTFNTVGTFAVPGAIAHWTFEDNANDIVGTFDPTSAQIVDISYVASRKTDAGKAASFNGTTSIIEITNGNALMNNGNWTMSLWLKATPHTDNPDKGHFVVGLGAFHGFQFEIFDGYNAFKLAAAYTNGTVDFGEDLWADGEGNLGWQGWTFSKDFRPSGMKTVIKDLWAHYVFVYNATARTGAIYLNGEKIKEQDFDNWPDGDNKRTTTGLKYKGVAPEVVNELALGFIQSRAGTLWDAEPWGGYGEASAKHFKGLMDDVIIYHKVITPAEITLMYNSGKP
jgi:Bacterial Ig-like domain